MASLSPGEPRRQISASPPSRGRTPVAALSEGPSPAPAAPDTRRPAHARRLPESQRHAHAPPGDGALPGHLPLGGLGHVAQEPTDHSLPEPETGSLAYSPPTPPLIGRLRIDSSAQAQLDVCLNPTSGDRAANRHSVPLPWFF